MITNLSSTVMPKTKIQVNGSDEFVSWVQRQLDDRGWSLGEAGRQTGIGKNVWHYWLNGTEPSFTSICQLAVVFNVDPMSICRMLLNRYCR
jgi:hypothetical protein